MPAMSQTPIGSPLHIMQSSPVYQVGSVGERECGDCTVESWHVYDTAIFTKGDRELSPFEEVEGGEDHPAQLSNAPSWAQGHPAASEECL